MSCLSAETIWKRGRFDARRGLHKLLFGLMYEDAAIELEVFRPGGRIFCIASAGCTAIKLAAGHEVVAVDINPVQLAYVEQRLYGGAIERGVAERLLAFLRAFTPLFGWSASRLRAFLQLGDLPEQVSYWRRHFDTSRFRVAVDLFFKSRVLGMIYSNSLLKSLPANFGPILGRRLERGFAAHANRTNPYLRALFLGESDCEVRIGRNLASNAIELVYADAASYLELQPAGSFDGFALSNILDGANKPYQKRLFAAVRRAAAPGAIAVLRSFSEPSFAIRTNRAGEDRSMLWGIVDVRPVSRL